MAHYRIALAGNPNAGKSTLFNALTGGNQHVGNWPGKTVEKKSGRLQVRDAEIEVMDLPGTYSLSGFSPEEAVARDYLTQAAPDLVVVVLDAANLERNLYLAVQVLELGLPTLVALNMVDVAVRRHIHIDAPALSAALGVPVVTTVGRRGHGIEKLVAALYDTLRQGPAPVWTEDARSHA